MRTFCIIFLLVLKITFSLCIDHGHKACHQHHKFHYLYHLHYLAFFALKFKVILIVGSLWAIVVIVGKIIAAFKITEYMKKDSHPQVIYSGPPHDYHHGYFDKNFESSPYLSSPPKNIDSYPSNKIYNPSYNYNMDSYKTLSTVSTGRSYLSTNRTPLENLKIFFQAIKRMNLTEIVFKEMKIETPACKKKFVCEADFNVKQSVIVKTIFSLFTDDCYKRYRPKEAVPNLKECAKLNPSCSDKDKDMHPVVDA